MQDDESLVTFMLLGCDGGSTCGGDCTWGMCDGTPSMNMHEAIITERNKRVFMRPIIGTGLIRMRPRDWHDARHGLIRGIQRRGRSSARSPSNEVRHQRAWHDGGETYREDETVSRDGEAVSRVVSACT